MGAQNSNDVMLCHAEPTTKKPECRAASRGVDFAVFKKLANCCHNTTLSFSGACQGVLPTCGVGMVQVHLFKNSLKYED